MTTQNEPGGSENLNTIGNQITELKHRLDCIEKTSLKEEDVMSSLHKISETKYAEYINTINLGIKIVFSIGGLLSASVALVGYLAFDQYVHNRILEVVEKSDKKVLWNKDQCTSAYVSESKFLACPEHHLLVGIGSRAVAPVMNGGGKINLLIEQLGDVSTPLIPEKMSLKCCRVSVQF